MKKFTKDDLQVNDIVTTRAGNSYMIHEFSYGMYLVRSVGHVCLDVYKNNLKDKDNDVDFDIVRVQRPNEVRHFVKWSEAPVIWERKEKEKVPLLSEAEYYVLKNSSKRWKWIARDRDGDLYLYNNKPSKRNVCWNNDNGYIDLTVFNHLFSHIEWEDDNPWSITNLLERYEEERDHENR